MKRIGTYSRLGMEMKFSTAYNKPCLVILLRIRKGGGGRTKRWKKRGYGNFTRRGLKNNAVVSLVLVPRKLFRVFSAKLGLNFNGNTTMWNESFSCCLIPDTHRYYYCCDLGIHFLPIGERGLGPNAARGDGTRTPPECGDNFLVLWMQRVELFSQIQ